MPRPGGADAQTSATHVDATHRRAIVVAELPVAEPDATEGRPRAPLNRRRRTRASWRASACP
jgi:hypothetical protein